MKQFLLLIMIGLIPFSSYSQKETKIDSLNYAGIKLAVPSNCTAKSEFELLDCDGFSIQWLYLNDEMIKTVPSQFMQQFDNQPSTKKKTEITLTSFGYELVGFKYEIKNANGISYRLIVFGRINKQPLLLNIGSQNDINRTSELNDFMKNIIEVQ